MMYNVGNPFLILSLADYMAGNRRGNSAIKPVTGCEKINLQSKRRAAGATAWVKRLISNGRKPLEINVGSKSGCIECQACK